MSKGQKNHQEHVAAVQLLGKSVSKRAGFRCEWCEGNGELRLWEYRPDDEPKAENLALLCESCRELSGAKNPDSRRLKALRNALWSDIPAISEGAAVVLARCKEPWIREAIEESFIDDAVKQRLL